MKPPSLRQCGRACNKLVVWSVGLAVLASTLALAFTGYVALRPISVTPYLAYVQKHPALGGYHLGLDSLTLHFERNFILRGRGVSLASPAGVPLVSAFALEVEFSNRRLLMGQLAPKHVLLDGAAVVATVASQTITVGDVVLPLPSEDGAVTSGPGIVEWLNNTYGQPRIYHTLRTLTLRNLLVRVNLPDKDEKWRFVDTQIRFSKYFRLGERLDVNTVITQGEFKLPAMLAVEHATKADTADVRLYFERSDADILRNHVPEVFRNRITGQARIMFGATLERQNRISRPNLSLKFGRGTLDLPELYTRPLVFNHLEVKGAYDDEADRLSLSDFDFLDDNGNALRVQGVITGLRQDNPHVNLTGGGSFGVAEQFIDYLPDAVLPETRTWLRLAINGKQATLSDVRFFFTGRIKDFPFDDDNDPDTGYGVALNFDNLNMTYLESMPPASGMSGRLEMGGNRIRAVAPRATLSRQEVRDVSVTIANLFRSPDPDLYVSLSASGEVEDVLGMVFLHTERGDFQPVKGRHTAQGWLHVPLLDDVQFEHMTFDVKADLTDIEAVVPYINQPLKAPKARVEVTDSTLKMATQGTIADETVTLNWQEDMRAFGDNSRLAAQGTLSQKRLNGWLGDGGLSLDRAVPYTLTLQRPQDEKLFEFELAADLSAPNVASTLNWQKPAGADAKLDVRGRVEESGTELWVDMLSFRAPDAEVLGSAILPGDIAKATIQLNPFRLGRTNVFVDYDQGNLSLMGEGLDVSLFMGDDTQPDDTPITLPAGTYSLNLRNLYLPKVTLERIEGTLQRTDKGWTEGSLSVLLPQAKTATVNIASRPDGLQNLRLYAQDAGHMLRALDIYDNIRGGQMTADMTLTRQYGVVGFEGEGPFIIDKGHIINAPIVVRILSLLWPGQLFSPQKGIAFDKIEMHLTLMEHAMQFRRAVMTGPSLGLRFDGRINHADDTIEAKGSLIPVEGLNKMVGAIPLVGRLLTGSQDALVAADFTVRGKMTDPQVSVNPLSAITPGLVKDIFGAIFEGGDTRPAPITEGDQ
jgi:hypothetical protein